MHNVDHYEMAGRNSSRNEVLRDACLADVIIADRLEIGFVSAELAEMPAWADLLGGTRCRSLRLISS
jgi:hypothetical protein